MTSTPTFTAQVVETALVPDLETNGLLDGWDRSGTLLPLRPCVAGGTRATLMVLTGAFAGKLVTVDGAAVLVGRAADADLIVDEAGVSSHHARVGRTAEGGFCVQDLESEYGTFVGSRRIDVALLSEGDRIQLGPHLRMRFAMLDATEESLYRRLYESSVRDPLTQVFNRRYLGDRLVAEIAHARRTKGEVAILMADLDRLKQLNDRFGHLAGDRALCLVASCLVGAIRVEDVLARYGGDEFVILARETDRREATLLAERIRRAIATLPMGAVGSQRVGMTMSVGVASLLEVEPTDEPESALLALADARMYRAKRSLER
jgi:diguanylate cyclase (GGDEF)-like protein